MEEKSNEMYINDLIPLINIPHLDIIFKFLNLTVSYQNQNQNQNQKNNQVKVEVEPLTFTNENDQELFEVINSKGNTYSKELFNLLGYVHTIMNSNSTEKIQFVVDDDVDSNSNSNVLLKYTMKKISTYLYKKQFSEIIQDVLYLGNKQASENKILLDLFNIKTIVIAGTDNELPECFENEFDYFRFPVDDMEDEDIGQYFHKFFYIVEKSGGPVFVHCFAGVSRSSSLVISYLMKKGRMRYKKAFAYVKRRREYINPNEGFIKQLKEFAVGLKIKKKKGKSKKKKKRKKVVDTDADNLGNEKENETNDKSIEIEQKKTEESEPVPEPEKIKNDILEKGEGNKKEKENKKEKTPENDESKEKKKEDVTQKAEKGEVNKNENENKNITKLENDESKEKKEDGTEKAEVNKKEKENNENNGEKESINKKPENVGS